MSLGIMSIFAGIYSDKTNRVRLIAFACILWSCTSIFSGEIHSFSVFVTMRIFLGVFSSAFKPASISLLRDYFDSDQRSLAYSYLHSATYVGNTLAIFSSFIIQNYGWRVDYELAGIVGIISGLVLVILVREPERTLKVESSALANPVQCEIEEESIFNKVKEASIELYQNDVGRNVTIAASLKKMSEYSTHLFLPYYFGTTYPEFQNEFIFAAAFYCLVPTTLGSIFSGFASDSFERKSYWAKSVISATSVLASIPLAATGFLTNNNFYTSIGCIILLQLCDSMWGSPSVVML